MSPSNDAVQSGAGTIGNRTLVSVVGRVLGKTLGDHQSLQVKGGTGTGADADPGATVGATGMPYCAEAEATALLSFITTGQAAASDPNRSFWAISTRTQEDPMDILRAGGLIDLAVGEHSYVFSGQSGSLDHAMVTPSLMAGDQRRYLEHQFR